MDAYSEFGKLPQELLNTQIVDLSDSAIGIFFKISDEKDLVIKFRENLELYFDGIIKGSEFKRNSMG